MSKAVPPSRTALVRCLLLSALLAPVPALHAQAVQPAPVPAAGAQAQPQAARPVASKSGPVRAPASAKLPAIKVGAISSMAFFPEAAAAARAYFDVVNASGGVRGRRLELVIEDDEGQPDKAAAAARRLVEDAGVVANVGSASILECAVNAPYYQAQGLISIQGTGADPVCFQSSNISPVNVGPYVSLALGLQFLTEQRWRSRVCAFASAYSPIHKPAYEAEIAAWSARTGKKVTGGDLAIPLDRDLGGAIQEAVRAGCEGVVYVGVEAHVVAWMKAVEKLNVRNVEWVFLTPAYTAAMPEKLGAVGEGIYAMSEFEPWTSRSPLLSDWRKVMVQGRVPHTSFSQGGYAAALVFVRVLRSIRGEITRESVTKAFKGMDPQKLPLLGTPYSFGPGERHASNRAVVPVQLRGGRWHVAHWEFIVAPGSH